MAGKWVVYGSAGVIGLGVLAAGAVIGANAMELHSRDGQTLPAGPLVGTGGGVLGDSPVHLVEKADGTLTIATAGSAASGPGSAVEAPPAPAAPVSPVPPAPADDSPASPTSPTTIVSTG